jgi:hypothetical protein
MKKSVLTLSFFMAVILAGCGDAKKPVDNAEVKKDTVATKAEEVSAAPVDSATMAKAWMDFMTPGDKHAWLAGYDGKWNVEMNSWMSPDAPPVKTTQVAESKMILGGRYQQTVFKGSFEGQPFEGIETLGFDNGKKVFVSTWVDNMGTGISMMSGSMDDATKTITFEGYGTDPVTGKDQKMRQVVKFPDANTQTMEMFCEVGGKEQKNMEVKMTRK